MGGRSLKVNIRLLGPLLIGLPTKPWWIAAYPSLVDMQTFHHFLKVFQCFFLYASQCCLMLFTVFQHCRNTFPMLFNHSQCFFNAFQYFVNAFRHFPMLIQCFSILFVAFQFFSTAFSMLFSAFCYFSNLFAMVLKFFVRFIQVF